MLAIAENLALAAKLEVELGELRSVRRRLERREALAGGRVPLGGALEEHLPRGGAPAHASPQLMEGREAEAVGVIDEHDRRVGDVDAHLDDRRGNENARLARAEARHGGVLVVSRHASREDVGGDAAQCVLGEVGDHGRGGVHP